MLFKLNRIRIGFRNALDNFDLTDIHFKAAGCALVGANFTRNDEARFLRQALQCRERFRIIFLRNDALQ